MCYKKSKQITLTLGGIVAGQRIDDHSSWMGKGGKYPLPMETKMKEVASADGAGGLMEYQDTNEKIVSTQKAGDSKIRSKPMKPGYRY